MRAPGGIPRALGGSRTTHRRGVVESAAQRDAFAWKVDLEHPHLDDVASLDDLARILDEAIRQEKAMKEWKRAWKIRLIVSTNRAWADLWDTING